MSANDFTHNHLKQAEAEVSAAVEVAEKRVKRLLQTAFQNSGYAFQKYTNLLTTRGLGPVIYYIEDRGNRGDRVYHFGFLNHGLFDRAGRQKVRQALTELPEAMQAHAKLLEQQMDLSAARRDAQERLDQQRFDDARDNSPAPTRGRSRE